MDGPHQLFKNRGNNNRWIEIDLEGVDSNRDGIGTSVTVEVGGVSQIRFQRGGMNRITQNHQRIHFGLGDNKVVDRLTIKWPSGKIQDFKNVDADRILTINERDGIQTHAQSKN
jgi:hypothetical protein